MTSHLRGLTTAEAAAAFRRYGGNVLDAAPHKPAWRLLVEKFREPLIVILTTAALVSMLTGGWLEGSGILAAVLLSVGVGFISEYRAGREFDLLNRVDDDVPFKTLRDGGWISCPRSALVVGDIVALETGEEIPADGEVLEAVGFQVDQSKFTGEPEPVVKVPAAAPDYADLAGEAVYPPERVLRGATVLSGRAVVRLTAVGMATEIGRTARAASEITDEVTPLQKQLAGLSRLVAVCGVSLSVLLFILLALRQLAAGELDWQSGLGLFMVAVTLIVVTVPEGLPMSVTLSLACSMRRMARSNCLIRRLHAAETIGCATVICTDKTGTLTMNCMSVVAAFFPENSAALVSEAIAVNSTAELNGDEVLGNPTEGALLRWLKADGGDYRSEREQTTVAQQWSFNTENKFMATRCASGRLHFKGAPEIILAKCAFRWDGRGIQPLDSSGREELAAAVRREQELARRTLAFAFSDAGAEVEPATADRLIWLGFVAIADPVRPEVPEAVAACRRAGIRIKIVTGDTAATAGEIAQRIGLKPEQVMTGPEFAAVPEAELPAVARDLDIIARARPGDKLRLVDALRRQGEVVAVTGDGTNDAPALHHADVGVAMGATGTAIAREAADIILLDDSFKSIVNAVLWGRSLYLNIQRFLVFQLTINVAAAGIALTGPFTGVELPFTVMQMLWINLIMDTLAALALATEPPTPEVMEQPPRTPGAFIVTGSMAVAIFGTAALFVAVFIAFACFRERLGSPEHGLTLIFSGFVFLQLWNLFNVRARGGDRSMLWSPPRNVWFMLIMAVIAGGQVVITQWGGAFFRTVPLTLTEWVVLAAVTSPVFWLGELRRWLRRRRTGKGK